MYKVKFSSDITFFAFRYCLGRHTGAPSKCVSYLIEHWELIGKNDRDLIIKEINDYINEDNPFRKASGGTDYDKQTWRRVLDMDRLTIYDDECEVKEKRWYEERLCCPDCSKDKVYYSLISNGKERWCTNCNNNFKVEK